MADRLTLADLHVLLVEDDDLIAAMMVEWLIDQQCKVAGPYFQLTAALEAARTVAVDIALLDVTLGSETVYPLAELLHERGTPFLLLSGYGEQAVPVAYPEWRFCSKPFDMQTLMKMMLQELSAL